MIGDGLSMTGDNRDIANLFARVGELGGKLDLIIVDLREAPEHRRKLHDKIDQVNREMHSVRTELVNLSKRVEVMEPTLEDYIDKQQQVKGASRLARAQWWLGGIVIAGIAAFTGALEKIADFVTNHIK